MDNTRFRRLPGSCETIWRFPLRHPNGIPLEVTTNDNNDTIIGATAKLRANHPLALTRTCQQIHGETEGMFYSVNTFRLSVDLSEDKDSSTEEGDEEEDEDGQEASHNLLTAESAPAPPPVYSITPRTSALNLHTHHKVLRTAIENLCHRAQGAIAGVELDLGSWYYPIDDETRGEHDENTALWSLASPLLIIRAAREHLLPSIQIPLFVYVVFQAECAGYREDVEVHLPITSSPMGLEVAESVTRPRLDLLKARGVEGDEAIFRRAMLTACRRRLEGFIEQLDRFVDIASSDEGEEEVDRDEADREGRNQEGESKAVDEAEAAGGLEPVEQAKAAGDQEAAD